MKENLFEMYARMCKSYMDCRNGCEIRKECVLLGLSCGPFIAEHPDKAKEIVEKWAKEHPIKTRQEAFLELYPNAALDENGVLEICACFIDKRIICITSRICEKCRKEYWGGVEE